MAVNIGPKIGIDGETEFRRQLTRINEGYKTLASEAKVVASEFIGNEKSVEALTKKSDVLERQVHSLTERLELQKQMLAESAKAYGEADERTMKWQQAVNETTAQLNKAQSEIAATKREIDEYSEGGEKAQSVTDKLKNAASKLGITFTFDLVSAAKAAFDALKKVADICADTVKDAAAYADNVNTIATNYGIAADKVQEYLYMSELVDTDMSTITGSIAKLTKSMDSARNGSGDAADTFRLLGINIKNADGTLRNASDVFDDVIGRLGHISDATERDTIAMTLFGKSAMELNSLVAAGADGQAALAEEARQLGYVLSEDQLASLGKVDDQYRRMQNVMTAIKNQIAVEMAPAIIDLSQKFLDFAKTADWDEIGKGIVSTLKGIGAAARLIFGPLIKLAEYSIAVAEAATKAADAIARLFGKKTSISSASTQQIADNTRASLTGATPSAAYYGNSGGTRSGSFGGGNKSGGTQVFTGTIELDGQKLGQATWGYNQAEANRRGPVAVR